VGGKLDVGGRAAGAALRHHVTGAAFALAALGGHAELELDLVKAQASAGMAGDFAVGDSAADANNHGRAWLGLVNRCADYKCESVAFAIEERFISALSYRQAYASHQFLSLKQGIFHINHDLAAMNFAVF
jgi:hypothetical protein